MFLREAKGALVSALVMAGVSVHGAVMMFNSTTPANNAAERTAWLAAIGIASPDHLEDFEDIALDTNISGIGGLLEGGIIITDTTSAGAAYVRGSSSFFGGSNPVDTRAVAHNEGAYLEIDLGGGVDYIGGIDIDHSGTSFILTYADGTTSNHSIETTGASGDSGEFWAFYRNDMPLITKIQMNASGDGEWGIDNLEYSTPVPEPASIAAIAIGAAAMLRKRKA